MDAGCWGRQARRGLAAAMLLAALASLPAPPVRAHEGPKAQEQERGRARDRTGVLETKVGLASYYARSLHGRETASGETFDRREMVAAHPRYPLGTRVRVTNRKNGRAVEVRINDRGPTRPNRKEGVIIDLSPAAAAKLGMLEDGRSRVRVEVLEWGDDARE